MSEYWVSKKKYWCQYCETFIADDVPSRTQHESGLRHKGNKERYIRNLYKTGIKKKQDSEEERVAMKYVEAAAQAAFAKDVSSGSVRASQSVSATASKSKPKPPVKPADPFANYTTATSLGITDPDVDFLAAEKTRKSEGVAGEWVAVVPPPPPLPEVDQVANSSTEGIKVEDGGTGEIRKREAEPVDEEDTRRFKLRKKTVAVGLGEIYDPGIIAVKTRTEKGIKDEDEEQPNFNSQHPSLLAGSEKPVWVSRGWKKAGESTTTTTTASLPETQSPYLSASSKTESKVKIESESTDTLGLAGSELAVDNVKKEEEQETVMNDQVVGEVKREEQEVSPPESKSQASSAGLFRKRKVPVNSAAGKRKDR